MFRFALLVSILASTSIAGVAQSTAPKDTQALAIVSQSLQALTGGTAINDVTLQAMATYSAGEAERMSGALPLPAAATTTEVGPREYTRLEHCRAGSTSRRRLPAPPAKTLENQAHEMKGVLR
jgi:hypothetical protein